MVFFEQISVTQAKVVVLGQSGCIRVKFVYSGKVVVFRQKWFYSVKGFFLGTLVLFG